jgi:hypothetical protein
VKVGNITESISSTTIRSGLLAVDAEVAEVGSEEAEVASEEDIHSEEETWAAGLATTTKATDHMTSEDMEARNLHWGGSSLPETSHRG